MVSWCLLYGWQHRPGSGQGRQVRPRPGTACGRGGHSLPSDKGQGQHSPLVRTANQPRSSACGDRREGERGWPSLMWITRS